MSPTDTLPWLLFCMALTASAATPPEKAQLLVPAAIPDPLTQAAGKRLVHQGPTRGQQHAAGDGHTRQGSAAGVVHIESPPSLRSLRILQSVATETSGHGIPRNKLWLIVSVAAHFPGAAASLYHYMNHYLDVLKFPKETFLIVVNFKSTESEAIQQHKNVVALLTSRSIEYTKWNDEYDSTSLMKIRYKLMSQQNVSPEDWIIITDLDEFMDYSGATAPEFYHEMDRAGYNYIQGHFVDRVGADGKLLAITMEPDISQQFPMECFIVHGLYKGMSTKAVAFKAYLRSNAGNHRLVPAGDAEGYKGFRDVYNTTPYYTLGLDKYCLTKCCNQSYTMSPDHILLQLLAKTGAVFRCGDAEGKYYVRVLPTVIPVMHYKWHDGTLDSSERRYKLYSGNISTGGQAMFGHYTEALAVMNHIHKHQGINIQDVRFKCVKSEPGMQRTFPKSTHSKTDKLGMEVCESAFKITDRLCSEKQGKQTGES